jgi:hypothetical protein
VSNRAQACKVEGDGSTCTLMEATRTAVSTQLAKGSPRAKLQGERERAEEVRGARHTITMEHDCKNNGNA